MNRAIYERLNTSNSMKWRAQSDLFNIKHYQIKQFVKVYVEKGHMPQEGW